MTNFKLTTETKVNIFGTTLFRIELTADCRWGRKGDRGGFLAKETNLQGDAWVSGNAEVYGNAKVYGNAEVYGDAEVSGNQWPKSPLQIQGTRHFVNVSKKDHLKIGCKEFSFTYWKENFKQIGIDQNYTSDEISEYEMYINLAIKIYSK